MKNILLTYQSYVYNHLKYCRMNKYIPVLYTVNVRSVLYFYAFYCTAERIK